MDLDLVPEFLWKQGNLIDPEWDKFRFIFSLICHRVLYLLMKSLDLLKERNMISIISFSRTKSNLILMNIKEKNSYICRVFVKTSL
jgi:hypothetical protein